MNNMRKLLSVMLTVLLLISMLPTSALAATSWDCNTMGHQWSSWEYGNIQPTCTEGAEQYRYCYNCRETETRHVSAFGHDWGSWVSRAEPTCTEGVTQHRYCNRCGLEETREVAALGHNWGSWKTLKEATCTEKGKQEHTCSRCGKTETRTTDALGHNWGSVNVIRESTCIQKGEARHSCSRCGKTETYVLPYADHKWGDWYVVVEPKPCTKGYEERQCSVCGLTEQRDLYPDGAVFRGDKGDAVKALQETLNNAGYDCGKADGIFGQKTEDAVKRAQADLGMEVDGVGYPCMPDKLGGGQKEIPEYEASALLELVSAPGSYLGAVGGTIDITYRVTNTGDVTISVYSASYYDQDGHFRSYADYSKDEPEGVRSDWLEPGESFNFTYTFPVTQEDMEAGNFYVNLRENCVVWVYPSGIPVGKGEPEAGDISGGEEFQTNSVVAVVPVSSEGDEPTPEWFEKITLEKRIAPATNPGNGEYYVEGEQIEYVLTLFNDSDQVMHDVEIVDLLKGSNEDAVVDYFEYINPGSSKSASFTYTVTAADVANGYVQNMAEAGWLFDGDTAMNSVNSNMLIVPAGAGELSTGVQLSKAASAPANGEYFVEGETVTFTLELTNGTENTLNDMWIGDPLVCEMFELLTSGETLEPGATRTLTVDYTASALDVEWGYVSNHGTAGWTSETGEEEQIWSNEVIVPVGDGILPDAAIAVTKIETSAPANGNFYVPGEQVTFKITVTNLSDTLFENLIVGDMLAGGEPIAELPLLTPHDYASWDYTYTVTDMDAVAGFVNNIASAVATDEQGIKCLELSEQISVPAGFDSADGIDGPFGVITNMDVVKNEVSSPANGSYYTEGETISYTITCTNTGEMDFGEVILYDSLVSGSGELSSVEHLYVGESHTFYFDYTVTAIDVAAGCVVNKAFALHDLNGYMDTTYSNTVISDTDGTPDDPTSFEGPGKISTPVLLDGEGADYVPCTRTLVKRSESGLEYTVDYCSLHEETQQSITLMAESATTDAAQLKTWQYARTLWQEELDEMYEATLLAADPAGKITVMNERVQFYITLSSREATLNLLYPDQPALVAEKIAELLMNKAVEMCYEIHTAPEARADRHDTVEASEADAVEVVKCNWTILDTENDIVHYAEEFCTDHALTLQMQEAQTNGRKSPEKAWEAIRQLWEVERKMSGNTLLTRMGQENRNTALIEYATFGNWLEARENMLCTLYPDAPATVQEVLAQTVMEQVRLWCSTQE